MNWLWYVRRGLLFYLSVDQFLFFLAVIQDQLRRVRMEVLLLCMLSELSLVCILRVLGVQPIHTCIDDFGQSIDEVDGLSLSETTDPAQFFPGLLRFFVGWNCVFSRALRISLLNKIVALYWQLLQATQYSLHTPGRLSRTSSRSFRTTQSSMVKLVLNVN